ncbi:MAG: hypothetical protein ACE5JD_16325 [Candidatus Methylomirabilia bacterium]
MIYWSRVAGLVGVLGTWFGMIHLDRLESPSPSEPYWVLGMAALVLAWIIAVLGLLCRMRGRFPDMSVAVSWMMWSGAIVFAAGMALLLRRRWRAVLGGSESSGEALT